MSTTRTSENEKNEGTVDFFPHADTRVPISNFLSLQPLFSPPLTWHVNIRQDQIEGGPLRAKLAERGVAAGAGRDCFEKLKN